MRVFKIPGKVQAKQRPRFNVKNGRVYTPEQTLNYESYVKWCYSDYARQFQWDRLEGALRVEIEVFVGVPKSDSKKKREEKLNGIIRPTIKPDADNIAKTMLDALNGIAYIDDKCVVECEVKKFYGEDPCVYVKLIELEC